MLLTLAFILLFAWLFGVAGAYKIGALVYLRLVVAVLLFVIGTVAGRRVVV